MRTEVDAFNIELLQTQGAGLFTIFARAVNLKSLAAFGEAELGSKEDVIAFSGALEPFADELFTVTIETVRY